jgi:hypothetical protein
VSKSSNLATGVTMADRPSLEEVFEFLWGPDYVNNPEYKEMWLDQLAIGRSDFLVAIDIRTRYKYLTKQQHPKDSSEPSRGW